MKVFLKIFKILVDIVIFLGITFLVFCFAYYFGWSLLVGESNWGNDAPFAMTYISYLARWYPPIPNWIYAWAGGMPFLNIYPPLATLVTYFSHQLIGWPIQQVMRLFFWLSIPLAAAGVVLLGRLISKSWWVGALAGAMMLFSPDSWLWITHGGFYAFSLAVPAFAWSLAIFVLACQKQKRFLWVAAVIFYGLTWLFHPMAGVMATMVFFIYGVGYSWQKRKGIWRGVIQILLVIIGGVFLIAYWLIPFYFFRQNQGIGVGPEQMAYVTFKEMVGLEFAHDEVYITSTFFTASVVILFFIGVIAAFLRRSVVRFLVLASLLAIFLMTAPGYARWLAAHLIRFWESTGVRAALILRILGPIIAAYGAVSLARPLFWGVEKIASGLKKNRLWRTVGAGIGGPMGLVIFFWLLKTVIVVPPIPENQNWFYRGFGPMYNWLIIEEKKEELFARGRRLFPDFPEIARRVATRSIEVEHWESGWEKQIKAVSSQTGLTDKERIEIVPFSGAITGTLTNHSSVSQIPAYVGISLIPRMIGWQVTCFYYGDFCGPVELEDLARWFGISWVWLGGEGTVGPGSEEATRRMDKSDLFEFKKMDLLVDSRPYEWNSYQFLDQTGLASIANKPTILVIGNNPPNNDVFDTVFRGLSKIDFGYKNAWSAKGKRFIDDYQLKELEQFEMVVLHGYQYHHKKKAWDLLEKYVSTGGRLFINTGWQYMNPDWGKEVEGKFVELQMPEIFPVRRTLWGNIGYQWDLKLPSHPVSEGVGTEDWGEPLWEGDPWGIALARQEWLREEAIPLLVNQDKVLVASRDYGQGKVVWTGFDFWGHLSEYEAPDEKLFLKNLFAFLLGPRTIWEEKLDFLRQEPDLIKISFAKAGEKRKLLFKEVASENWQALLITSGQKQKIPIFQAGPGWKLVFLPEDVSSGEIVFNYQRTWYEWLGRAISILTAIGLVLFLVGIEKKIHLRAKEKTKALFLERLRILKGRWESEEY